MKLFKMEAVDKVYEFYQSKGGEVIILEEGSLLDGLVVCIAPGFRSCVIREVFLNEWSSGYKVRTYRKLPKNYEKLLEEYYNKE